MEAAVSNDNESDRVARPAAVLRGTAKGLEIHVDGQATASAIAEAVGKRLHEAPGFFRGSDVRIKVDNGPLAVGTLGKLDELAVELGLRIVEVAAVPDAVPVVSLAAGSAPSASPFEEEVTALAALPLPPEPIARSGLPDRAASPDGDAELIEHAEPMTLAETDLIELVEALPVAFDEPTQTAVPLALAAGTEDLEVTAGTRLVLGPVRSGVILEHHGHLIVFGDVNPGAEIRAQGNIVVLGRLRGTAHAGIGQDVGFILALRLEPQQLRIGRRVARAADSDTPILEAELAHCTGDAIVVERYVGKLPRNLATSI